MRVRNVWQEYTCPGSFDFDLFGADMAFAGLAVYCSGCGDTHVGGGAVINQTTVLHVDDADEDHRHLEYRGLPRDAAQLAAWLAEIGFPSSPEIEAIRAGIVEGAKPL